MEQKTVNLYHVTIFSRDRKQVLYEDDIFAETGPRAERLAFARAVRSDCFGSSMPYYTPQPAQLEDGSTPPVPFRRPPLDEGLVAEADIASVRIGQERM